MLYLQLRSALMYTLMKPYPYRVSRRFTQSISNSATPNDSSSRSARSITLSDYIEEGHNNNVPKLRKRFCIRKEFEIDIKSRMPVIISSSIPTKPRIMCVLPSKTESDIHHTTLIAFCQ